MVSPKYNSLHSDGLLFALDPADLFIQSVSQSVSKFIFKKDPFTFLNTPFLDLLESPREFVIFLDNHFTSEEDHSPIRHQVQFHAQPSVTYDIAVHCPMMGETRFIIVEIDVCLLLEHDGPDFSDLPAPSKLEHPCLPEPVDIPSIEHVLRHGDGFLIAHIMNEIDDCLHACPDKQTLFQMMAMIFRRLLRAEHTHFFAMYDETSKRIVGLDNDPAVVDKYQSINDRFHKQIPTYMSRSYTQKYVKRSNTISLINRLPASRQELIGVNPLPLDNALYRYPTPLIVKIGKQLNAKAGLVTLILKEDFQGGLVTWFSTPRRFSFQAREFVEVVLGMFSRSIEKMLYQEYLTGPMEILSISPDASASLPTPLQIPMSSHTHNPAPSGKIEDSKTELKESGKTIPERAVATEMEPIVSTTLEYLSTVSRQVMPLFWADAVIIYAHETLKFVTHLHHDETLNPIAQYFINAKVKQLFTTSRAERDFVMESKLGYSLPASDEFTSTAALLYIPLKESGDAFLIFLRRMAFADTDSNSTYSEESDGSNNMSDTGSLNQPPLHGSSVPTSKQSLVPASSEVAKPSGTTEKSPSRTVSRSQSSWTDQQMSMSNLMCVTLSWFLMMQEERANSRYSDIMTDLMLGNLTHEFRTPIHTIMNFVEMILEECSSEDAIRPLKDARETTDVLLGLVNDILFLASLKTSRVQSSYTYHFPQSTQIAASIESEERVDLSGYFAYLWESLESSSLAKDVQLIPNIDSNLDGVVVLGPIKPFQYGLSCLMRNAIKWTREGSIKINIRRQDSDKSDIQRSVVLLECNLALQSSHKIADKEIDEDAERRIHSSETVLAILNRLISAFDGKIIAGKDETNMLLSFTYQLSVCDP